MMTRVVFTTVVEVLHGSRLKPKDVVKEAEDIFLACPLAIHGHLHDAKRQFAARVVKHEGKVR